MNCSMIKTILDTSFSSLFSCRMVDKHLAIETPFTYPDGSVIEVFLHERSNKFILSDLGETMRYLGSYDLDVKTTKREKILQDVTHSLRVKYLKGMLYLKVDAIEDVAESIFDLSQCVIRVCDLLYTVRGSSPAAFVEEVKDFLDFRKYSFEENIVIETESDNRYEFDLGIHIQDKLKLVKLMSPPSRPTQSPTIDRIVRTWVDLEIFSSYRLESRITLLDDTNYQWKDRAIKLINKFSSVSYWSDKEQFEEILTEAKEAS